MVVMHLYTLTGSEKGWWTVSLGGRVWLPKGELPFGLAKDWDLIGQHAKIVGEWQGETVWLIHGKNG
ncbi:NAD(+) diphosphatase [Proteus penneri ATCC 35198]|nr:NAD(+) diphosphatase [Proteus penneri ATCC 35198]